MTAGYKLQHETHNEESEPIAYQRGQNGLSGKGDKNPGDQQPNKRSRNTMQT